MKHFGFRPAFLDFATMQVYPSCDGLPEHVGRKATVVAGYVRNGYFYTRSATIKALAQWPAVAPA